MEKSFLHDSKVGGNIYREISKWFHWLVPGENVNCILQLTRYFSLILKSYIYFSGIFFCPIKRKFGDINFLQLNGMEITASCNSLTPKIMLKILVLFASLSTQ